MLRHAEINKKLDFQEAVRIAQAFLRYLSLVAQTQKEIVEKARLGDFQPA